MSYYPLLRMRRLRSDEATRRLVAETALSPNDFIWPLFVHDEPQSVGVDAMPDVIRHSFDDLLRSVEKASQLNIPFIALFPVIPAAQKDEVGTAALDEHGLVVRAIKLVKQHFPTMGIVTDIALDPYTTHGHDGLIDQNGEVLNDETVQVLCQQAQLYAAAGADIVAPSDMMDGRVQAIRHALEADKHHTVKILSYAAKFASSFYGPFREMVGSAGQLGKRDKKTYQINPTNAQEAMREIELDISEGADMVMVKPGMPYLDIIANATHLFNIPVVAYQVSGEYAMLKAAAQNGWLNGEQAMIESLTAFKRAGCSGILTYFAPQAAELLRQQ